MKKSGCAKKKKITPGLKRNTRRTIITSPNNEERKNKNQIKNPEKERNKGYSVEIKVVNRIP